MNGLILGCQTLATESIEMELETIDFFYLDFLRFLRILVKMVIWGLTMVLWVRKTRILPNWDLSTKESSQQIGITFRWVFVSNFDDNDSFVLGFFIVFPFSQEAISHLQSLEEDLVDGHRSVILNLQRWAIDDASLLAVTNEVDYDQDGQFIFMFFMWFKRA